MWTKWGYGQNWECGQNILTEAHQAINRIAELKLKSKPEFEVNQNWISWNSDDIEHRIENWH